MGFYWPKASSKTKVAEWRAGIIKEKGVINNSKSSDEFRIKEKASMVQWQMHERCDVDFEST